MSLDSNLNLMQSVATATLVWLWSRNDLQPRSLLPVIVVLLGLSVYRFEMLIQNGSLLFHLSGDIYSSADSPQAQVTPSFLFTGLWLWRLLAKPSEWPLGWFSCSNLSSRLEFHFSPLKSSWDILLQRVRSTPGDGAYLRTFSMTGNSRCHERVRIETEI